MILPGSQSVCPTPLPTTLDTLSVGATGCVRDIVLTNGQGMHLMEMGLTPGTRVRLTRVAPLGDPIGVQVRGYQLSLRRSEARLVSILPDSAAN